MTKFTTAVRQKMKTKMQMKVINLVCLAQQTDIRFGETKLPLSDELLS